MTDEAPKPLTRAERSALRKAAHAEEQARKEAERRAAKAQPLANLLPIAPPQDHAPRADVRSTGAQQPPPAPPPPDHHPTEATEGADPAPFASHAHMHARAHEGSVLADAEFAGFMDQPTPPETPATAFYVNTPHSPTPQTHAEVTALRYAGQSDEEVALYLGCSIGTLYHYYRQTLAEAHAKMSGRLAIKLATAGLTGDFKAMKFIAEKRLRGFGKAEEPFVAVRPDAETVDRGLTTRNAMGQSPAAIANRAKRAMPEPGPDGRRVFGMVLGVAERPLTLDENGEVVEATDADVAADVRRRAFGTDA